MTPEVRVVHEGEPSPGDDHAALAVTWHVPRGFPAALGAVSHHVVGKRYITTAFVFLLLGGLEALVIRLQLARPDSRLVGPDLYNQVFTMHGTTMMFLFAVPVMEGMGIYLVPLMIGTRNVAFPRMNAFGYWMYLIGGIFLYVGFFTNTGADAGWFAYTPLSGPQFSAGKRVDFWSQMITFTEISALVVAIELVVTILKQRAPGMSLDRMPMFVWAMLVQSFMVIFAMPAVMLASGMLLLDRAIGTHFFNPAEGGDPLLWQHLFWFFGHPEVYIIFIPALGMVSEIVIAFSRRPAFGYTALVLSLVGTAFLGFGLWVHHMFATGLSQLGAGFFTAASMMIAIPSGVQIFCWLATLGTGTLRLRSPLLFVLGFLFIFTIGGLTGVMVASVPFDLQAHDTFFVVAHFHYVLIGGAVFPLLGGVHFWFPKLTGRMLDERLARASFWLLFVGFNLTFFPMHWLGLDGMPRRIYTYGAATGWGTLNAVATAGGLVLAAGFATFFANVLRSRRHGVVAGDDPWAAGGLEWTTASPPPDYNFAYLPVVRGRHPAWQADEKQTVVVGLRTDRREVLVTQTLDAVPDHRYVMPYPTVWPLVTALAASAGLIASVFKPWTVYPGVLLFFFAMLGWFWPRDVEPAPR